MSKIIPLLSERGLSSGSVWHLPCSATQGGINTMEKVKSVLVQTPLRVFQVLKRNHCFFSYLTICIDFYLLFILSHKSVSAALVQTSHEYIHCCICHIKSQLLYILFRQHVSCFRSGAHSGNGLLSIIIWFMICSETLRYNSILVPSGVTNRVKTFVNMGL